MSTLLSEHYLWTLPNLITGVLFTMTAWLRMSDSRPMPIGETLRTSGRLIAYSLPLMIAMWIFFPRIATPFWAVPIDTSTASSGLSNEMSPGDVSSLSLSDAVAFRVKFDGEVPPNHKLYWRGLVLQRFNGRTWTGREASVGPRPWNEVEYDGESVAYQVTMEPTRQQWVISLDVPYRGIRSQNIYMSPYHGLIRMQPIDQRLSYQLVSYTDFRLNTQSPGPWGSWYSQLPEGSNPQTVALARDMREQAGSSERYINRVLRMFNTEDFYYTLEPPPLGSNSVDRFLFDTRRGFCEHYASAFAVMMRAAGIPSRIVLGYQGGEINTMSGDLTVRQADAHAWTEVWLPGRGWYRVDPTAAVAPERIEMGRYGAMIDGIGEAWGLNASSQWIYQVQMAWDAMNAKWNEWILAYGPDNQGRFMEWLGMEDPDWRKMMLTLVTIVVVLIAGISALLIIRYRPPPRDRAAQLYRKFTRAAGVEPARGETPYDVAARIVAAKTGLSSEVEDITGLYLDVRYGPPQPASLSRLQSAVQDFSAKA